ncbi:MAG: tryptophan-rich sensory protein [Candidatus Doudnabacteria bacterium]|nr:tryptophan-rich sensory protein [Candidatus Doudnabacteria bacterium]
MDNAYNWYNRLILPSWAPPKQVFAPVWTVLYMLIAVSFGTVFYMAWQQQISLVVVLPFVLNLLFNFSFTTIQFRLRNNLFAAADILLVLATIVWAAIAIFPFKPWIAYIQTPYFLWVIFATALQLTVSYLNRIKK